MSVHLAASMAPPSMLLLPKAIRKSWSSGWRKASRSMQKVVLAVLLKLPRKRDKGSGSAAAGGRR